MQQHLGLNLQVVFVATFISQLMVNCWFRARWFGFCRDPLMIPGLLRVPLETRLCGHAFRRGCRGAHGNPCSHEFLLALGSRR